MKTTAGSDVNGVNGHANTYASEQGVVATQAKRVEAARSRLESMRRTGFTPEQLAEAEATLRREENEATLCHLAALVAQGITTERLRPILRELVLMAELEREAFRRERAGRSLLRGLQTAGIRVRLDGEGRLIVGPREALTKEWRRFIGIFRGELVRELTHG